MGRIEQGMVSMGCDREEKEEYWKKLDEAIDLILKEERLIIGADFNRHAGEGSNGDERVIGKYGYEARNDKGDEKRVDVLNILRETAKELFGVTTGKKKRGKEMWWWNEEVQEAIAREKEEWESVAQETKSEKQIFCTMNQTTRQKVVKQKDRVAKDVQQIRLIKDAENKVLTIEEEVLQRWRDYFERLMDVENSRETREENGMMEEVMVVGVTKDEVKKALKKIKKAKL
ncbi:uncharacterized protein LOC119589353 [Penaeus monodon]|uniref:uncharacterized protein LOC119589353 n=1 Tax=Penaeus monodon TaxID=6687 RepID=UPI0018A75B4A|nr:uncharacterized protein LOC119589353 [Penaeus monodon]